MRVRFTLTAKWELREIGQYTAANNPEAALRLEAAIRRAASSLQMMPWRGRKQKTRNVRKIGTGKYSYDNFYQIDKTAQVVTIVSIRHAARRPRLKNT